MEQAQSSGEVDAAAEAVAGLTLDQGPPAGDAPRRRGSVRWFNASKGFGFIQPDDALEEADSTAQHDLFVHQTSIQAEGFRSLREGEEVEFDVQAGEDGRNKAVNVTGPSGAPPLGAPKRPPLQQRRGGGPPPLQSPLAALSPAAQQQHQQQMMQGAYGQLLGWPPHMYGPGAGAGGGGGGGFPPGAYGGPAGALGMYASPQRPVRGMPGGMRPPLMGGPGGMGGLPGGLPQGGLPPGGMGYLGASGYPGQHQQQQPGGRSGRYPGGGVADRRPPPGTPGISTGLQVVVHNLPWTCSWQQLKDAFAEAGVANIERVDVIIDSSGRSRGFGTVSFPTSQDALAAVERMNNADIGGRAVAVRIDRFA